VLLYILLLFHMDSCVKASDVDSSSTQGRTCKICVVHIYWDSGTTPLLLWIQVRVRVTEWGNGPRRLCDDDDDDGSKVR